MNNKIIDRTVSECQRGETDGIIYSKKNIQDLGGKYNQKKISLIFTTS